MSDSSTPSGTFETAAIARAELMLYKKTTPDAVLHAYALLSVSLEVLDFDSWILI
jgi:hypothetical protein